MNATSSDRLLETLIARTIGEEPAFAMSALAAASIPAGVIRYMRTEITNRLADDLSRAPHFARVATPTPGPDAVRDALLTHAAGQYIFPRAEFLELLDNAARFTENYLCRPRWTLSSFLFSDQSVITTDTLLRKLEYVADYAYLPQLLRRLVTQSGKQVITSVEGVAYITRIDDAIINEHSPREQAMLARPIFQFFLLSDDIDNTPIALRALLLFLEDKQLSPLRDHAQGVWHMRGKTEITIEEFAALCEDYVAKLTPVEAPPPAPVVAAPEPPPEPVVEPPPLPVQESLFPEEPSPFSPDPELTIEPEAPAALETVFHDDVQSEPAPQPEAPIEPPSAEEPKLEPTAPLVPSLNETIPADMRRRFVNVVCGKDAEFYDLVITRLDEMRSWPDASAYIRELFEINGIDPFDEIAIAFTDIIQKRCGQLSRGTQ
jgi:hypothetical protein